jgi:hypothetical protein
MGVTVGGDCVVAGHYFGDFASVELCLLKEDTLLPMGLRQTRFHRISLDASG